MAHHNSRILAATGMAAGLLVTGASGALAADGPNQPGYWEDQFEGYTNVECDKRDSEGPYTVDAEYIAVILKAGSGDDQNQVIMNPEVGTTYDTHENGKEISHVIFCTGEEEPPVEEPPVEEPPVEEPPVEEPPAEEPPAEEPPAEEPPAEEPPAEEPPAEEPPAEGPPAEEPPAEGPPAEGPPAEMPPAEMPPVETPATPETPTVVQTDGWATAAQDDSMLGMLGLAALLGGGAAVVVIGARTAARRD